MNIAIFSQALLYNALQITPIKDILANGSEKSVKIAAILKGATILVHYIWSYGFKTHVPISIYAYGYEINYF